MYKIPKVAESSDPLVRKGLSYMYMTSDTVATGWKTSKKNISSRDSIPGNTLSPIYTDVSNNYSSGLKSLHSEIQIFRHSVIIGKSACILEITLLQIFCNLMCPCGRACTATLNSFSFTLHFFSNMGDHSA